MGAGLGVGVVSNLSLSMAPVLQGYRTDARYRTPPPKLTDFSKLDFLHSATKRPRKLTDSSEESSQREIPETTRFCHVALPAVE